MNKQREQEFKFRCERLAMKIAQKTDIIFTEIRYVETLHNVFEIARGVLDYGNPSERQMSCAKFKKRF